MKKNRIAGFSKHTWLCGGICLICAMLIKPAQDHLESLLGEPCQESDLLYFTSPALVKKMALGYEDLIADIYWMRAIQYYGRREEASRRPVRYANLATLLDITTTLDPDLIDAYRSGSIFLAEADPLGAGQPEEAIKLLDRGIAALPQEWRLVYDKGFVYYLYLKDYEAAGKTWLSAGRLPQAPHWMAGLAAMSLSKGGSIDIAIALWQRQYQESSRADVKENARNHLLSIQVDQDFEKLNALIVEFQKKNSHYPESLEELVRGKTSGYSIEDPLGTPYEYNAVTGNVRLSPETKVHYMPTAP
jgi:tetratricopeptide (TPR) repeat protein